jgi:hypothetical protein
MDYSKIHTAVNKAIRQGVVDRLFENIEEIKTMIQDDRSDEDIKLFFVTLFEEAKKTKRRTPTKPASKDEESTETGPIFQMTPEEFVKEIIEKDKFACSWFRKKGKLSDGTDCAGKVCGKKMTKEQCCGDDGELKPFYTWRCSGPCKRNTKASQDAAQKKIFEAVGITNEVHGTPTKNFNIPSPAEGATDLPTRAEEVSGIDKGVTSPTGFLNGETTGLASPSASRGKKSPKPPTFKLIKTTDGSEKKKTEYAVSKSPVNGSCLCYHRDRKKVCGKFDFDSPPDEFDELFLQGVRELNDGDKESIAEMGLDYEYMGKPETEETGVFESEDLDLEVGDPEIEVGDPEIEVGDPGNKDEGQPESEELAELLSQLGTEGDSD